MEDIIMVKSLNAQVVMSRNGMLVEGMKKEDIEKMVSNTKEFRNEREKQKYADKLAKAFEMADGLGENGIKDGVISNEEIKAYDKAMRKKKIRNGLLIAGGVLVAAAATYLAVKGIKANNMTQVADAANPHNLVDVDTAEEVGKIAKKEIGSKKYRVATAGYSAPPEGYEESTKSFLKRLKEKLGGRRTAFVTSPTADKGSIDAITTEVAGLKKGDIFYTTAKDYVEYIDPAKFPESLDKAAYSRLSKHVLPNAAEYSRATAEASNMFVATGGRNATVSDFVNAINKGNKAIILDNSAVSAPAWGDAKKRVENAAKYIAEQFEAFMAGKPLPYENQVEGFTEEFMAKNRSKLEKLVKIIRLNGSDEAALSKAVEEAASFLK